MKNGINKRTQKVLTKSFPAGLTLAESAMVTYVRRVQKVCGELCDLKKKVIPGEFMGTVTSKVIMKFFRSRKTNHCKFGE